MTSTVLRIREAAPHRHQLLAVLSETDHAGPSLQQQKRLLTDLESELAGTLAQIAALDRQRKKDLKDHHSYQDSIMKRFAYKMARKSDKFEAKAAKEERDYFAVLQEEHKAQNAEAGLRKMLDEAKHQRARLERDVARHRQAERDLDSLYDSIFQGPTPQFPDEDELEKESLRTLQAYHDVRVRAEAEAQAVALLEEARVRMSHAVFATDEALSHSRIDMFGAGTFSDMLERDALHRAEMAVASAERLVRQARRMSPQVGSLPHPSIAQGSLISDIFFDNIFTDIAFHHRIAESRDQVAHSARVLDALLLAARARQRGLEAETNQTSRALETARMRLQEARGRIFEQAAASSSSSSA